MDSIEIVDKHTIYETIVGSRLYGTFNEESDTDYKGIAIPPKEYYLGFKKFEQLEKSADHVIYDLRKAISLMINNNPNMLDLLFAPPEFRTIETEWWYEIYKHRHKFLTKHVKNSFGGYAKQQLTRMKNHKKWIKEPPKKPNRKDFDVENIKINSEHLRTLLSLPDIYTANGVKDICRKERKFQEANKEYKSYNEHIAKRNPERLKIEMEVGYDTKHAMHLIRLLRQCKEILEQETVIVNRIGIDADHLIKIRNGDFHYEEIIEEAENLEKEMNELYLSSKLPEIPDYDFMNKLVIGVVESYWND